MTLAQQERAALSDLFSSTGPGAPTLCGEWQTSDLAAHLVLRERRMDAAAGIMLPLLESYTGSVQRKLAARPWVELVQAFRSGPPWWSPWAIPALDRLGNGLEFFVHHEDVRRAQPDWSPRPADKERYDVLRAMVGRAGPMLYRKAPVGVRLQIDGGSFADVHSVPGRDRVTVAGTPDELVMHAFGREDHARVEITGEPGAVAELSETQRGM